MRVGLAKRKVRALFIGVVATGLIYPFLITAALDQADPLLAWVVSLLAAVIGAFRGRDYSRRAQATEEESDRS